MTIAIAPITFEELQHRVRDLPALPAVVMDLIASFGDDRISSDDIVAKLSRDPALTAKTLRMANSSFYGMARQIGSVPDALTILGMRTVRTVVLAAGVTGSFQVPEYTGFDFKAFWRHAIGGALCAQALAPHVRMDSDVAFTVGLLHDIGSIALACSFPEEYADVLEYMRQGDCLLIEAEQAILGTDHAAMGARIAEHWHFSPVIVEAIEYHHAPAMHHGPGLVGLTHMADAFSHALGLSGQETEIVPLTPPEIWAAMAPGAEVCIGMFEHIESQFEGVCQALHV
jgi:putative nucleotidyltransferase with HDIG domain